MDITFQNIYDNRIEDIYRKFNLVPLKTKWEYYTENVFILLSKNLEIDVRRF